jgi:hypothetical protein
VVSEVPQTGYHHHHQQQQHFHRHYHPKHIKCGIMHLNNLLVQTFKITVLYFEARIEKSVKKLGYWLNDHENVVLFLVMDETVLYSQNRLALGPKQPLFQWVYHSPPSSAKVKKEQKCISTCPYAFMALYFLLCYIKTAK